MNLSLDQIMADLKGGTTEASTKTASAKEPVKETQTKVSQAKAELVDALKRAENAAAPTKTAAEAKTSPVADVEKVASELAAADMEALTKEAQFYGAAICDGFMARLQQYEKSAAELPAAKTASAEQVDVEKIAAEAVRGYVETQNAIKFAAEQEYVRGYNDTMKEVEKIASDVYGQGVQDCANVLAALK